MRDEWSLGEHAKRSPAHAFLATRPSSLVTDRGAIHVKVVTIPHHDPVEMNAEQVREFAANLLKLADELGDD